MAKPDGQGTRDWITKRYGPIGVRKVTLYVATVPVYKGVACGEGMSENDAVESLYKDLTEISGPVDVEPQPALEHKQP